MEYRIQKDSIVAEIIKRTGSEQPNQNDNVPSMKFPRLNLLFAGMYMDYQISSQCAQMRISTNKASLIHLAYHITRGIYGECCSIVTKRCHIEESLFTILRRTAAA